MLSCINFNALWNSLCFLEKKLATILYTTVPETYFMDLVLGMLLPASNTQAKQKLFSGKHKQWEHLGLPIILLNQESRVLSVDDSSQFLPDKTQRHVQGMVRPMEYLFKGSTLAKGM